MDKKIQTKDIDTLKILKYLESVFPKCVSAYEDCELSIFNVIPKETPFKLILSKMKLLIKKGFVDGCGCGCRGDFVITKKGMKITKQPVSKLE